MEEFEKFFNQAIRFLSYRIRSEKEIRDYLHKKQTPIETIEKIVQSLKEHKFINDEEFARRWIESRTTHHLKSKKIIRLELFQKGIDKELIEKLLEGDAEMVVDDIEQARKLIEKKLPHLQGFPPEEVRQKLGGFLARKGFSWDTIKKSVDKSLDEVQLD